LGTVGTDEPVAAIDQRAAAALVDASGAVVRAHEHVAEMVRSDLPPMGLVAGDRPTADVEVLCSLVAQVEYEFARRTAAAARAGSLPLVGDGAMALARGWSTAWARRLARAGSFVEVYPGVGQFWAAGLITSEHVDALARVDDRLSAEEMAAVVEQLSPLWGQLSPQSVAAFVGRVIRVLHPPEDPAPDESAAHESRSLSFALTSDSVVLSGSLPRVEGEVVMAAIDAFAERLRSEADHVPAAARRADGLVALVNAAHTTGRLPSRGGLPVSLTVTLDRAGADEVWTTSRGHTLTEAERRFTSCDALVTPVVVEPAGCPSPASEPSGSSGGTTSSGTRIAALATALLGTRQPLLVGRTERTATAAQRRALAARDRGCIIPGCGIPAEACQTHHVADWAAGGPTDVPNLVLLCWAHHRQVDLKMWTITAFEPDGLPPDRPAQPAQDVRWPANNGAPWVVVRMPRSRWRL